MSESRNIWNFNSNAIMSEVWEPSWNQQLHILGDVPLPQIKSKMPNGRHRYDVITPLQMVGFRWNLVSRCRMPMTINRSSSKLELEFQYSSSSRLFSETRGSNVLTTHWDIEIWFWTSAQQTNQDTSARIILWTRQVVNYRRETVRLLRGSNLGNSGRGYSAFIAGLFSTTVL